MKVPEIAFVQEKLSVAILRHAILALKDGEFVIYANVARDENSLTDLIKALIEACVTIVQRKSKIITTELAKSTDPEQGAGV